MKEYKTIEEMNKDLDKSKMIVKICQILAFISIIISIIVLIRVCQADQLNEDVQELILNYSNDYSNSTYFPKSLFFSNPKNIIHYYAFEFINAEFNSTIERKAYTYGWIRGRAYGYDIVNVSLLKIIIDNRTKLYNNYSDFTGENDCWNNSGIEYCFIKYS